ncbi:recombination regulator RecX [Uliginosibacterium sp. TH139]|uniref:recombination regulator RecX n=1 Tax=Uliginosibacterium sp. TH139 TaxID=2067453 RepID=UPI000C796EA4|nr:recombination regulator RecX [Uliginosibacterium sp. TH139]PLK50889.1 recombination regulator RecX [Uliginosibacterium sp. TH139]
MKKPAASLSSTALRLLATREHSRLELRRKLAARAGADDDVEAVLDRMAETGLQSDERFAESFVRSRASRFGAARIRRELDDRGVDRETAAGAMGEALQEDELMRAHSVWQKKFGVLPQDHREWARQARFLQTRGFAVDIIRKLLKETLDESAQG